MGNTKPIIETVVEMLQKIREESAHRSTRIEDKLDGVIVDIANLKAELKGIKRRLYEIESANAPTGQLK